MKVLVKERFNDLKQGCTRERGEVFTCTKERFDELLEKLPGGYVEKAPTGKAAKDGD